MQMKRNTKYIKNQPFYLVGTDEYDNKRKSKTLATFTNFIRPYSFLKSYN